ncbi:MAG TPA: hypothetical protein VMR95_03340 [Candidatus Binatia bacterium]|nr:hypothetical protein [Candidatus Binatia bacterium]
MRDVLAIVLSGIWLFGSGIFVYVGVLNKWNEKHFGHISRDTKSFPIWAAIAEKILQAVALTLLVRWTNVALLPLLAIPVLLVCASYLSTYADYRVSGRPVLVLTVIDSLRIGVALVIVGLTIGHTII